MAFLREKFTCLVFAFPGGILGHRGRESPSRNGFVTTFVRYAGNELYRAISGPRNDNKLNTFAAVIFVESRYPQEVESG